MSCSYLEVVLFADKGGGHALLGKCDEGKMAPGVGDEHVHHVTKPVKVLHEVILGQGLKQKFIKGLTYNRRNLIPVM